MSQHQYTVIYEEGPRNWSAYVPDLPGCVATGKTREETEARITEAIQWHLEGMEEDGVTPPAPKTYAGLVPAK